MPQRRNGAMKSYAEQNCFSEHEVVLLREAQRIVNLLDDRFTKVRCHELARGIGQLLGLKFADGRLGVVNHTWLWTHENTPSESDWWESGRGWSHDDRPKILDVYRPGVLPQVVLIDTWVLLPYWKDYKVESRRDDIDQTIVDGIVDVGRVR